MKRNYPKEMKRRINDHSFFEWSGRLWILRGMETNFAQTYAATHSGFAPLLFYEKPNADAITVEVTIRRVEDDVSSK